MTTREERIKYLGKELDRLHEQEIHGGLSPDEQQQRYIFTFDYKALLDEIETEERDRSSG